MVTVALTLLLPASAASARPIDDPTQFAVAPRVTEAVPPPIPSGNGGPEPLGYIAVGLGGVALGAVGHARTSTARRSRRAVEA
jgi:hypothetical protein